MEEKDSNDSHNNSQEEESKNSVSDGHQESKNDEAEKDSDHEQIDAIKEEEEERTSILQNLKDIFELFDSTKSGKIPTKDLENILTSLNRNPEEAKEFLEEFSPAEEDYITFDEFVKLMDKVENRMEKKDDDESSKQKESIYDKSPAQESDETKDGAKRTALLDFLILLEDYRAKCESEGKYAEARKCRIKYEELLRKETIRQKNNIRISQEQELQSIENAQKAQFLEFSQAWDNYMSDYEATAYLSLEKLKEKHILEFQQFSEKVQGELRKKMKFSKDLIELRDKEAKLVKLKRYEEAEKVKMKADLLEQFERNKLENEMQAITEKKEAKLKHKQQLALAALLKRIQRDRNEQLNHRQIDSQRLIQRNKNILNDLINKQHQETKRTLEMLKKTLSNIRKDKKKGPLSAKSTQANRAGKASRANK
ncbi:unnamed protein product [Moneuplotes crassus]|uniref:EF-hand domain-containing protein n=2 Tax=Euplotes crassus TaxID=5936 RepID=A0AAD1XCZ7_EUPCR|nr:unnamed protein product [Moneuplotes crassus]